MFIYLNPGNTPDSSTSYYSSFKKETVREVTKVGGMAGALEIQLVCGIGIN